MFAQLVPPEQGSPHTPVPSGKLPQKPVSQFWLATHLVPMGAGVQVPVAQLRETQSRLSPHDSFSSHGAHPPPQSTSVSVPFCVLSSQVAGVTVSSSGTSTASRSASDAGTQTP